MSIPQEPTKTYRGMRRPVQVPDNFDSEGCYSVHPEVWPQVVVETLDKSQEPYWLPGGIYEWGMACPDAYRLATDLIADALPDLPPNVQLSAVAAFYVDVVLDLGVTWRLSQEWIRDWWEAEKERRLRQVALKAVRNG